MNAWLPQASYPCGNLSDTPSFKFQRTKGSIGHTTCGALPAAERYLRLSRFQGGQAVKQKR